MEVNCETVTKLKRKKPYQNTKLKLMKSTFKLEKISEITPLSTKQK